MGVYKRGRTYWFKFRFEGQLVRESAKTNSKTVAREAERARRRELELAINGLSRRERPLLPDAANKWFATKTNLRPSSIRSLRWHITKLSRHFGKRLISDITTENVVELQRTRLNEGLSASSINKEIMILGTVLRYYGRWSYISGRIKMLPKRTDVGRALSREEEARLVDAIRQSCSPSLYPFFILSLDAGLRPSETRSLRRSNLLLNWQGGLILSGEIIVGQSKTDAGAGRVIPLTRRASGALTSWLAWFPEATSDAFVFPSHRVAMVDKSGAWRFVNVDLGRPMSPSSYKTAFRTARRKADIRFRFYDARHTFVTRLAENPTVSEETIRQLAGHVDPRMLGRYAHIRVQARRNAIATLEEEIERKETADDESSEAQNRAQSKVCSQP
jgi:integrase